jgi:hypothetical protein
MDMLNIIKSDIPEFFLYQFILVPCSSYNPKRQTRMADWSGWAWLNIHKYKEEAPQQQQQQQPKQSPSHEELFRTGDPRPVRHSWFLFPAQTMQRATI